MNKPKPRYFTAPLPLTMYDSWVEVIEKSIKEIMRINLCLPNEIKMERLNGGECKLSVPIGQPATAWTGYDVKLFNNGTYAWYEGIPFYETVKKEE